MIRSADYKNVFQEAEYHHIFIGKSAIPTISEACREHSRLVCQLGPITEHDAIPELENAAPSVVHRDAKKCALTIERPGSAPFIRRRLYDGRGGVE